MSFCPLLSIQALQTTSARLALELQLEAFFLDFYSDHAEDLLFLVRLRYSYYNPKMLRAERSSTEVKTAEFSSPVLTALLNL